MVVSAPPAHSAPTAALDLDRLFRTSALRIARIVEHDVAEAPAAVVEDACQTAWARLAVHRDEVQSGAALAWLATTAKREAARLWRRAQRDLSLDDESVSMSIEGTRAAVESEPHELVGARARLGELGALSARQQRLVWLQALGLSYEEMAALSGGTVRTVHRQLVRARHRLGAIDGGDEAR